PARRATEPCFEALRHGTLRYGCCSGLSAGACVRAARLVEPERHDRSREHGPDGRRDRRSGDRLAAGPAAPGASLAAPGAAAPEVAVEALTQDSARGGIY